MGKLIELLLGLVWPGGASVAHGVTNVISIAALAPLAFWFLEHKEDTAIAWSGSLTWGQLAVIGLVAVFFLKLAQYSHAPQRFDPMANWRAGPPL